MFKGKPLRRSVDKAITLCLISVTLLRIFDML